MLVPLGQGTGDVGHLRRPQPAAEFLELLGLRLGQLGNQPLADRRVGLAEVARECRPHHAVGPGGVTGHAVSLLPPQRVAGLDVGDRPVERELLEHRFAGRRTRDRLLLEIVLRRLGLGLRLVLCDRRRDPQPTKDQDRHQHHPHHAQATTHVHPTCSFAHRIGISRGPDLPSGHPTLMLPTVLR